MVFFDLNVPYLERDRLATASSQASAATKAGRLKVVVKAMEIGYTGVAYNRTVKGVVSEADRCKIPPLPLSSLLNAAPALAAAATFHRELLGVPLASPFRQYTRLTVAVDSALGAASLHPGNAVLRTYHLVAARPLNQAAFDQACKVSEVDLIAIDFSQKLPFRLKLSMVKAAIKRGVYFEVNYSPLISDVHTRRQTLSNAKVAWTWGPHSHASSGEVGSRRTYLHLHVLAALLGLLVDWTRGKNLILSSGTSNINEVRGPYDVINLASLLGLSMERAKVAISRNCRSLLNNALRRKQCYKEAIRVEKIIPSQCLDRKEPWFFDWGKWDPISSGEGDLPALDDIAKFLSASGQGPKSYSEINFDAVSDVVQFDRMFNKKDLASLDDGGPLLPVPNECEPSASVNEASCQEKLEVIVEDEILSTATPLEREVPDNESDLAPPPDFVRLLPSDEASDPVETPSLGNMFDVTYPGYEQLCSGNLLNIYNPAKKIELPSVDDSVQFLTLPENPVPSGVSDSEAKSPGGDDSISVDTHTDVTSSRDLISDTKSEVSPQDKERPSINLMEIDHPPFSTKDAVSVNELFHSQNMPEIQVLQRAQNLEKDPFVNTYDTPFQQDFAESEMAGEDDRATLSNWTRFPKSSDTKVPDQSDAVSLINHIRSNDILVDTELDGEVSVAGIDSQQGKLKLGEKLKRKPRHPGLPLLSRHFMHHLPFKKKAVHSKRSRKNIMSSSDGAPHRDGKAPASPVPPSPPVPLAPQALPSPPPFSPDFWNGFYMGWRMALAKASRLYGRKGLTNIHPE
ncbi:hypothetical protein Taro_041994, partial [Colocasia esculenta]|nr:hypothetical protein [Colocasia esculenta]